MKWKIKKGIFSLSLGYVTYFVALFVLSFLCQSASCRVHDSDPLGIIFFLFLPLLPVFIFSLITYRMSNSVFKRWLDFSIWAVPVLMILTFIINGGTNNGLGIEGAIGGAFDVFLIGIFYLIYCAISSWLIFSKHKG